MARNQIPSERSLKCITKNPLSPHDFSGSNLIVGQGLGTWHMILCVYAWHYWFLNKPNHNSYF